MGREQVQKVSSKVYEETQSGRQKDLMVGRHLCIRLFGWSSVAFDEPDDEVSTQ